jgi:hypothetical protein
MSGARDGATVFTAVSSLMMNQYGKCVATLVMRAVFSVLSTEKLLLFSTNGGGKPPINLYNKIRQHYYQEKT